MKGQMFLIAAFLMVGGLVVVFNILGIQPLTEEKRFVDTQLTDNVARNVVNEYFFAAGIGSSKNNVTKYTADYFSNFSAYIRSQTSGQTFYAIVVVNGSTQAYSLNVGNYLGQGANLSIGATNSNPSSAGVYLNDGKNTTFAFTTLGASTADLTITYATSNRNVTEMFSVNTGQKNFLKAFVDLTLTEGSTVINLKDTYNRTWI